MRLIDMSGMDIVSSGVPWAHAMSPCSKLAIHLLERNAKIVTWLMPKESGGEPHEQVPCIMYKGKYFSLSLRMQKAIYRHVRLKKGFKNEETVNGFQKLRIPDLLLKEKIRTQSRFDVSNAQGDALVIYKHLLNDERAQAMRNSKHHKARERTKSVNTVASKMKQVVVSCFSTRLL
jgi:hypothetical protein